MTYAAVMTHVQPDAAAAPRLACAVDIAKRFGATLSGVAAEMIPPLAIDGGFYSLEADWTNAMRETIDERLEAARKAFDAATIEFRTCSLFSSGMRLPDPAIAAASRAADLIVAGGAPRSMHDGYRDCSAAELAITSGRPVLVAPPDAKPLSAKTILLAWKDTREARRALSDALPFFHLAERVVVCAVCDKLDAANAQIEVVDVARSLRWRGIKAEAKVVEHAHPDGFQILRQASLEGADLIVCGAYGHSRLGEWVFGGVTRDLLSQDQVYLLFSH
jgi:nucleotide-binding universal stress UspA family protein